MSEVGSSADSESMRSAVSAAEDFQDGAGMSGNDASQFPSSLSSISIDPFFVEAMSKKKDQQILLQIDNELERFINSGKPRIIFPPLSSYHRLMVHKAAEYFGLEHTLADQPPGATFAGTDKRGLIVSRTSRSCLPLIRFSDLIETDDDKLSEGNEFPKKISIMKREKPSTPSSVFTPSIELSPSTTDNIPTLRISSPNPVSEEEIQRVVREKGEEYERARARIFHEESEGGTASESISTNQPSWEGQLGSQDVYPTQNESPINSENYYKDGTSSSYMPDERGYPMDMFDIQLMQASVPYSYQSNMISGRPSMYRPPVAVRPIMQPQYIPVGYPCVYPSNVRLPRPSYRPFQPPPVVAPYSQTFQNNGTSTGNIFSPLVFPPLKPGSPTCFVPSVVESRPTDAFVPKNVLEAFDFVGWDADTATSYFEEFKCKVKWAKKPDIRLTIGSGSALLIFPNGKVAAQVLSTYGERVEGRYKLRYITRGQSLP